MKRFLVTRTAFYRLPGRLEKGAQRDDVSVAEKDNVLLIPAAF